MKSSKRVKICHKTEQITEPPFEKLPDDLLIYILSKLSSSSSSPSHFFNALMVCKRFNELGMNPLVLSKACSRIFAISADKWSESVHNFLKLCVNAGNSEACYFLGMLRFYCLGNKGGGASLMAKAAFNSHAPALYSLAVIQFNGSGGAKTDKDLCAGVALCARAAYLGHVDALRDLGHCFLDGYGITQNVALGHRLLVQASARELASVLCKVRLSSLVESIKEEPVEGLGPGFLSYLIDLKVPVLEPHPVNRFLVGWFKDQELGPDIRVCSYPKCGRPETRPHEFRRCSVCGVANYCSRGCQSSDWKDGHKDQCSNEGADQLA